MSLTVGTTVVVTTGKDRKKSGKITAIRGERAVVEGLNMVTKHQKAKGNTEAGIVRREASIHLSNLRAEAAAPKAAAKKPAAKKATTATDSAK